MRLVRLYVPAARRSFTADAGLAFFSVIISTLGAKVG